MYQPIGIIVEIVIMIMATIALIGFWASDAAKGAKIACTSTFLIAIITFILTYFNVTLTINDSSSMIGAIATIISIPTTILIGWNIYSAISIKEEWDKFKEEIKKRKILI